MMYLKSCCDLLEKKALKIAFIESATSGYLAAQFSIYKNSGADILLGGLVSYDPIIKQEILHIPTALIQQYSAESREVTQAMAKQGQCLFSTADMIVACTGLLKPGGSATAEKPEGTFFISILFDNTIHNADYFLMGTPMQRLNALTEHVAEQVLRIIQS
jgi:nicotinamide-nucleotide amidase